MIPVDQAVETPTFECLFLSEIPFLDALQLRLYCERSGRTVSYYAMVNEYRVRPPEEVRTREQAEAWYNTIQDLFLGAYRRENGPFD